MLPLVAKKRCFVHGTFVFLIQPKNHLNFSEEPETDKSNETNEDLETLPSSCYASAKDNTSKSEVDFNKCGDTNTKNNLTPESGINSPNCELTSTDLQSPRLKIINRNVSVRFCDMLSFANSEIVKNCHYFQKNEFLIVIF